MRIPARRCAATLALVSVAVLADGAQAAQEPAVGVTMAGRAYQPGALTVGLGQTVVWSNQSITHHTVTSTTGLFGSSSISPGESYSVIFSNPGTFDYECTIHPTMKGSVVVLDVAPGTLRLHLSARRTAHGAVAVATVRAARSGPLQLQARSGGAWRTVARGKLDAQGRATITVPAPAHRPIRVVLPAQFGQPRLVGAAERSPA